MQDYAEARQEALNLATRVDKEVSRVGQGATLETCADLLTDLAEANNTLEAMADMIPDVPFETVNNVMVPLLQDRVFPLMREIINRLEPLPANT